MNRVALVAELEACCQSQHPKLTLTKVDLATAITDLPETETNPELPI